MKKEVEYEKQEAAWPSHDASDAATKRNNPFVVVRCIPIGGDGRLPCEIPTLLQVVVDEVLKQKLIHIGQVGMTSDRPDVICKSPECPLARLYQ